MFQPIRIVIPTCSNATMDSAFRTCGGVMGTATAMMARMRMQLVPCRTVRKGTSSVMRPGAATLSPGSVTETLTAGQTDPTKVQKSVVSDWILKHWIFLSIVQCLLISNSTSSLFYSRMNKIKPQSSNTCTYTCMCVCVFINILNLCIIYIKFSKLGKVGALIIC